MRDFEVGDWVVRKDLNCTGYWKGYNNTPVQIIHAKFTPCVDIKVELFPEKWWAAELFTLSSPPNTDLKEWL